MTTLVDETDLGNEVHARLRRFAAGVTPNPPDWRELIDRSDAVVLSLRTAQPVAEDDAADEHARLGWRPRRRVSLVAAAIVAVALAGGLLVDRTSEPRELSQAPASFSVAAPTDAAFDARTAPAVWASGLDDPVAAAQSYLAATGVTTGPGVPAPAAAALRERDHTAAVVEWSAVDGAQRWGGTVFLRRLRDASDAAVDGTWAVVGSASDEVALQDVRYDGEHLSFTIASTSDLGGLVDVAVWAEGRPASAAGGAVAQAGSVAASAGELIEIGKGARQPVTVVVQAGVTAIVQLQHVVEGELLSVTELAIVLPGPDTAAEAGTSGSASVDAGPTVDEPSPGADRTPATGSTPALPDLPRPGVPGDRDQTIPTLPTIELPDVGVPDLPGDDDPTIPSISTTIPAPPVAGLP
jgi:hypothetical protein